MGEIPGSWHTYYYGNGYDYMLHNVTATEITYSVHPVIVLFTFIC